jgi:amino acid transporter
MLTVTVVYGLVQVSVIGVLPRAADHAAPIASALGELLGRGGGALASVTALIAGSGWLLGFAQMTPRILYAMAERHELPSILGRVHPRYRTPHIAILVNSCAALGLGLYGSFVAAVTLAAIPRLIIFGLTCVALIVFRRRLSTPRLRAAWRSRVCDSGDGLLRLASQYPQCRAGMDPDCPCPCRVRALRL